MHTHICIHIYICYVMHCVAVYTCSTLFESPEQVCCSVLNFVAVCYRVLQSIAACRIVLQCVAACCSVLQRVAVCWRINCTWHTCSCSVSSWLPSGAYVFVCAWCL